MAKTINDSIFDAALNHLATSTRLSICSGQPADFAGISAVSLGNVAVSGVDFTNSDGDVSGRKVTVSSKTITPTATGTAIVATLDDGATLLATTDISPSFGVTLGVDVDTSAFDWEIRDPA